MAHKPDETVFMLYSGDIILSFHQPVNRTTRLLVFAADLRSHQVSLSHQFKRSDPYRLQGRQIIFRAVKIKIGSRSNVIRPVEISPGIWQ